ncbi:AAA family ATPase [Undibacterium curvum]|uniref:AAA family ATPase n=1 Tax=Undibacterium curvum TaxID=2762294 RepID=A0ABR7A8I0_9BURK|nr:AAA family ATPase [Undibacterium curvum]MBC3933164.1 AAA family ATPase [Undibacterium curvum]
MNDQNHPEQDSIEARATANQRRVSLRNLFLDPNNFRIIHEPDQKQVSDNEVKNRDVMHRTLRLVCGDKNQGIQDLIDSFKTNGYLRVDQILVRELEGGNGYVVVEGNRRIAALKHLQNEYESKGIDLGKLNPEIFSQVPVVLYVDADEVHHLTLMALKHISGNKKWGEWNQAQLLEQLHMIHGLDEEEICKRIGISKVELRRSLRALALVTEYKKSDYGDQFNESIFPIFRHAVRSAALKNWLDWEDKSRQINNSINRDFFFSLLSREPMDEQDDDGSVGFGGQFKEPVITRRDDIDIFAKVIADQRALEYLKKSRDLNGAYRSSDIVFSERQEAAVRSVTAEVDTLAQLAISPQNVPGLESVRGKLQSIIERARTSGLVGVEQKAVFRDRVDAHFSEIHVQRYRGLAGLEMKKLSRINIIAGINNSGKTSLLEAIYLLARQNDLDGLIEVMRRRGKVATDQLDPEWMLEQLGDDSLSIDGMFDQLPAAVNIEHRIEEDSSIDRTRYLGSIDINSNFGTTTLHSINRIYKGQDRETHADSLRLLCPVIFSSPFFFNEPHRYTSFYHKSVQSKALPDIFKFLQENLVPTLEDIRLTDERQRFVVIDRRFSSGVDLSCYGEGLQRMFLLSLLFASAQHGIMLIDEFENALHYHLIEPFSRFIYDLAKKFNVQVFLTSHSKECIDTFINAIPESDDLSCHAIVNTNDGIRTRDFSGSAFKKLLEAGDVDLRGAQ